MALPLILPALAQSLPAIIGGAKKTDQLLQEKVGYDFLGLITKMILVFALAKALETYVHLVNGGQSIWLGILSFVGVKVPTTAPSFIVQLVTTGFNGIKYWHLVSAFMMILLFYEWYSVKDKITPMTTGVFALLGGLLAVVTLPDLFNQIKEAQILKI